MEKYDETLREKVYKLYRLFWRRAKFRLGLIKSKDVHNYWLSPEDKGNQPKKYFTAPKLARVFNVMIKEIIKLSNKNNSIMEIGCNVGRNLNDLHKKGYKKLYGVEINKEAVGLLKKEYKSLAKDSKIYVGPIEKFAKSFKKNQFDILFTLATFQCINKEAEWVFKELANSTKKYMVLGENEGFEKGWKNYPRNYRKVFEKYGFKQVKKVKLWAYTMRILKKK